MLERGAFHVWVICLLGLAEAADRPEIADYSTGSSLTGGHQVKLTDQPPHFSQRIQRSNLVPT